MAIKAADVSKLRQMTGAGMMDCKNALTESNGDFDKAVEIIRKKGQLVANKRSDREATEGAVLSKTDATGKFGAVIVLNCETDFVAKNENFVAFAQSILDLALDKRPASLEELKKLDLNGRPVEDQVTEQIGVIGEKLELPYYEKIEADSVAAYIHPGNKLATLVGFNQPNVDTQVGRDIAMQVAAMNPVSVDKESVPAELVQKELEIGKEKARLEGKPENILDKIAQGRLGKFFKENTLVEQVFVKDSKVSVGQYLDSANKGLKPTIFFRYSLKE